MSKSKLDPDAIFWDLKRKLPEENVGNKDADVKEEEGLAVQDEDFPANASGRVGDEVKEEVEVERRKKPGPTPNPENARRVRVVAEIPPETKYAMKQLIDEMVYRGYVDKCNMTDFVTEAIQEKIDRDRQRFGLV